MKKKILIIDDDLIYQNIIRKLLYKSYDLEVAGNSIEAINKLNKWGIPELIIADLNLPGIHGLEFMLNLKEKLDFSKTKVLVISGMDDDKLKEKLKEVGITDILTKPIDRKELQEKVYTLIEETPIQNV